MQCNNGGDDDADGLVDAEDPGCEDGRDNDETDPDVVLAPYPIKPDLNCRLIDAKGYTDTQNLWRLPATSEFCDDGVDDRMFEHLLSYYCQMFDEREDAARAERERRQDRRTRLQRHKTWDGV